MVLNRKPDSVFICLLLDPLFSWLTGSYHETSRHGRGSARSRSWKSPNPQRTQMKGRGGRADGLVARCPRPSVYYRYTLSLKCTPFVVPSSATTRPEARHQPVRRVMGELSKNMLPDPIPLSPLAWRTRRNIRMNPSHQCCGTPQKRTEQGLQITEVFRTA
jgi:hypothetical protein